MTDRAWEIDAPSLAITICWGDATLHSAHLDPPRSFFLGGHDADCALPEEVVGADRAPLILVERGALYLVLRPSMDPDGAIVSREHGTRRVADLARPGIAATSPEAPGGFLVPLVPGLRATLSIGDFAITIALENKAARRVAGRAHPSARRASFHLGSAAVHLGLMAAAALAAPDRDPDRPTDEQILYMRQVFSAIAEREAEEDPFDRLTLRGPSRFERRHDTLDPKPFAAPRPGALGDSAARTTTARDGGGADARAARSAPSAGAPISTRAVDVDAYAATRRQLERGELPRPSSVRPAALLSAFDHRYPGPTPRSPVPFAVHFAAAPSPFTAGHHLLRVGVQGRRSAPRGGALDRAPAIIARDLRIQVDFEPRAVASHRRIGEEDDDGVGEALGDDPPFGEVAPGYSVTAVYDVVLSTTSLSPVTVRIHYRTPLGRGREQESVVAMSPQAIAPSFAAAPASLRLAAAVAGFAEILGERPGAERSDLDDVERVARDAAGDDDAALELVTLVQAARSLTTPRSAYPRGVRVANASLLGY